MGYFLLLLRIPPAQRMGRFRVRPARIRQSFPRLLAHAVHIPDALRAPVLSGVVNHPVPGPVPFRTNEKIIGGQRTAVMTALLGTGAVERVHDPLRNHRGGAEPSQRRHSLVRRALHKLRRMQTRQGRGEEVRETYLVTEHVLPEPAALLHVKPLLRRGDGLRGVALEHPLEKIRHPPGLARKLHPAVHLHHVVVHEVGAPSPLTKARPQRIPRHDVLQLRTVLRSRAGRRVDEILHRALKIRDDHVAVHHHEPPRIGRLVRHPERLDERGVAHVEHLRRRGVLSVRLVGVEVLLDDVLEEPVPVERSVLGVVAPRRVALAAALRGMLRPEDDDLRPLGVRLGRPDGLLAALLRYRLPDVLRGQRGAKRLVVLGIHACSSVVWRVQPRGLAVSQAIHREVRITMEVSNWRFAETDQSSKRAGRGRRGDEREDQEEDRRRARQEHPIFFRLLLERGVSGGRAWIQEQRGFLRRGCRSRGATHCSGADRPFHRRSRPNSGVLPARADRDGVTLAFKILRSIYESSCNTRVQIPKNEERQQNFEKPCCDGIPGITS